MNLVDIYLVFYLSRSDMSDKKIESGKYKIDMTVVIYIMRGKMFDHQPWCRKVMQIKFRKTRL